MLKKANFYPVLILIITIFSGTIAFAQEDIVINEIMYAPTGNESTEEWVELYNKGTNSISLKNWKFYDGTTRTLTLISGTWTIPPGGYPVLTENPGTFTSLYPTFTGTLIEASSLGLNNDPGDTLCMITPAGVRIGSVTYYKSWGAYNNGKTLEKIYPAGDNTSSNWRESKVTGGTPCNYNSWTPMPSLIFNKKVTPVGPISIGGTLTYTLSYENIGFGTATNVVLTDAIPAGTIYITGSASGAGTTIFYSHDGGITYDNSQSAPVTHIRWEVTTDIAPGSSGNASFAVRIE